MPRKSAAELEMEGIIATMPGEKHERPDPPEDMPEAAAAVWRDAVASMKKMHFSRETHALLTRYCNAPWLHAAGWRSNLPALRSRIPTTVDF